MNGKHPLITVGALIFNEKNQALFLISQKWNNKLGIPSGKLNYGESIVEGLKREIKEETGLDVYNLKLLLNQELIEPNEFYKNAHFVSLNYTCKTKKSKVILNEESQDYKWVTAEKALKLNLNEPTKELVKYYLKMKNVDKIIIKDLEIDCIVGIRKKERKEKQKIYVSVDIYTNIEKAAKSKNINDTINYSAIIKNIKKLVVNNKYLLLESTAKDISKMILKNRKVNEINVMIKKPNAIKKGKYVAISMSKKN